MLLESNDTRLLIDPGVYSTGFESLKQLDAILVTHQHADHIDAERLGRVVSANPRAALLFEPETAAKSAFESATAFAAGDITRVGSVQVSAVGGEHAANHDQVLLNEAGRAAYLLHVENAGPDHTELRALSNAEPTAF